MSARHSIWRHAEPSERIVKNVDAKASSAQVRELARLDALLARPVAYETYERMTGVKYMARVPAQRYKALDRLTASDLIQAYKASA